MRYPRETSRLDRLDDGGMFDAGRKNRRGQRRQARMDGASQLDPGADQRIRGLGRARCKDNILRLAAHQRRHIAPRRFDNRPCGPAFGMDRGRISRQRECRQHGFTRCRMQRCRRVPVEIGTPAPIPASCLVSRVKIIAFRAGLC